MMHLFNNSGPVFETNYIVDLAIYFFCFIFHAFIYNSLLPKKQNLVHPILSGKEAKISFSLILSLFLRI